jgi:hypothetical protein
VNAKRNGVVGSVQVPDQAAWLRDISKEACRLAIKIGFGKATQTELGIIRELAAVFIETGTVDRTVGEACLERLRTKAYFCLPEPPRLR